ncbi:MAG: 50S ribosomal protein L11 methyltransferase [Proteobacteria bacterium]|nr:50S ribosomal protein L11 methyltransferase [Pseudomonadota bacterium]
MKNWLLGVGEETFVEGVIDDLYLDLPYESLAPEQYEELGGDNMPLLIYKYDRQHLVQLKSDIEHNFLGFVNCEMSTMLTETWMEGWKESFKPIRTSQFYIYPPWLADDLPQDLLPICIEPGMAFGTGQHATTILCVQALEELDRRGVSKQNLLDVGTGTGILAIAADKLGFQSISATDIDPDSIMAAAENSRVNGVTLHLEQGSFPHKASSFNVVLANIIFYVLRRIIADLAAQTDSGGYLVLSGLLAEEAREMESLAEQCKLKLVHEAVQSDWACQIYQKV